MKIRTLLDLGRVSNLPTVWSNVLAGAVLSGSRLEAGRLVLPCLAGSCFYVGGMFLNDAFDREWDARVRSERPIPSGRARAGTVFSCGFALLAVGIVLVVVLSLVQGAHALPASALAALVLAGLIVFYDAFHKQNPLSAVVMGLCRAGLYVMAAVMVGTTTNDVWLGAFALLVYIVGLTGIARQENLASVASLGPSLLLAAPFAYAIARGIRGGTPLASAATVLGLAFFAWVVYAASFLLQRRGPQIGRAVASLIAGVCLLDALLIALHAEPVLAAVAALGLPLTLLGQRYVRGT